MERSKKIKLLILILIVIMIILIGLIVGLNKQNAQNKQNNNFIYYGSVEEVDSLQTLINQLYGNLIRIEDSTENNFYQDIYINLKYGLYENGESKQEFFSNLIENVANKMYYENFRIIDDVKEIEIKVICNQESVLGSLINGDTDFYGHYESQKNLSNYTETSITNFDINSIEINNLVNNNWEKSSLQLQGYNSKTDNYERYSEMGISIYEIQYKVFNIIFDTEYQNEVISSIKVGENFGTIIEKLGAPTFGSIDENYIGYKGENLYVFFSKDEISVYRNETNYQSDTLVELINKYIENSSAKELASGMTDLWLDYDNYNYGETYVELLYTLKGIKVQLGTNYPQGILVYNNYVGNIVSTYTQDELKNKEMEIPNCIFFINKDSVNEYEKSRIDSLYISDDQEWVIDNY